MSQAMHQASSVTVSPVVGEDTLAVVAHWSSGIPPSDGLAAAVASSREALLELLHEHGALLFRDTGIADASAFEAVTRALVPQLVSYVGGATPRSRVSGEVYTSTELASSAFLALHNETSYFVEMPNFVWFFCKIPSKVGGETPLGDMSVVLQRLDPDIVERFASKNLCYVSNLHGGAGFGKSWQSTYQTEDRDEVEAHLRQSRLEFQWTSDGGLRVLMRAPALRTHKVTGRAYWGNQATIWHPANLPDTAAAALQRTYGDAWNFPRSVFFGDESPIAPDDIRQIAQVLKQAETTFKWEAGDILLVDNQAIAHGRRPFVGERQIMVALA